MGLETVESQYLDNRASLNCADETAAMIDEEVMKILKDSYKEAKKLLKENRDIMDKIADYLIQKETITGHEFMEIFCREKGIPMPAKDKGEEALNSLAPKEKEKEAEVITEQIPASPVNNSESDKKETDHTEDDKKDSGTDDKKDDDSKGGPSGEDKSEMEKDLDDMEKRLEEEFRNILKNRSSKKSDEQ
jgi:cell division protease FtsH